MSKTIDQLIEEQTREYHNNCAIHLDDSELIAFKVGANFVKAEMQKEIDILKSFWKDTLEKFKKKYLISGHANVIALTALTEAFDIHCENEDLQKENEKLKSLLQKAVEALENLQGHTDAILLFPHKDKIDLFKAEQSARQTLADIKKEMGEL